MKGLSSDSKLKGWILRLRGLPFNATDEDVVRSLSCSGGGRRKSALVLSSHCVTSSCGDLPEQYSVWGLANSCLRSSAAAETAGLQQCCCARAFPEQYVVQVCCASCGVRKLFATTTPVPRQDAECVPGGLS